MIPSSLFNLLNTIEHGTKLHTGVLFMGNYGNKHLHIPFENTIHSSPFCTEMKKNHAGYRRCFACRNAAIRKALKTKQDFGGVCINGVYEYTRPVTVNGEVACIIFIGNILPSEITTRGKYSPEFKKTMEPDFGIDRCIKTGEVIESYIRMVLELYPRNTSDGYDALTENIKKYIEENIQYEIKLSHLSSMFHYNEKYLGRLFKKQTSVTLREYITMRRIELSKKLLSDTDMTIISISEATGFGNVTYFNRMFRKHTSLTPTQYRRLS